MYAESGKGEKKKVEKASFIVVCQKDTDGGIHKAFDSHRQLA